jgi:hypothetical protein
MNTKKNKKPKRNTNKGKKYQKPLSLYGMEFEQVVDMALKCNMEKIIQKL